MVYHWQNSVTDSEMGLDLWALEFVKDLSKCGQVRPYLTKIHSRVEN